MARPKTRTTIEISKSVRDRLSKVASKTGMTYSDIISMLLDVYEYLSSCRARMIGRNTVGVECSDSGFTTLYELYENLRKHIPFLPRLRLLDILLH